MNNLPEAVKKAIAAVEQRHPYKVVGRMDTYDKYNEGWSDACDDCEDAVLSIITTIQPQTDEGLVERMGRAIEETIKAVYKQSGVDTWPIIENIPQAAASCAALATAHMQPLVEALEGVEGKIKKASKMIHDSTQWNNEDGPQGHKTIMDFILHDTRAALSTHKNTQK